LSVYGAPHRDGVIILCVTGIRWQCLGQRYRQFVGYALKQVKLQAIVNNAV
jgi:hypothetical protein